MVIEELLGLFIIAVITIEVAVYAIIASLASRITRLTEKEFEDKKKYWEDKIETLSAEVHEKGVHQKRIEDLKEVIAGLEKTKSRRKSIRKWTGIFYGLGLPVSFSIISLVCLGLGIYYNWGFYGWLFIPIGSLIVSLVIEALVLTVIGNIAKAKDDGGFGELKKIIEETRGISEELTTKTIEQQSNATAALVEKLDELIIEIKERMGLKKAEFEVKITDTEYNVLEKIELKVGVAREVLFHFKNKSEYPVINADFQFALPKGFQFEAPKSGGAIFKRPPDFEVYPGGITFQPIGVPESARYSISRRSLVIKGEEEGEYKMVYYINTVSHYSVVASFDVLVVPS